MPEYSFVLSRCLVSLAIIGFVIYCWWKMNREDAYYHKRQQEKAKQQSVDESADKAKVIEVDIVPIPGWIQQKIAENLDDNKRFEDLEQQREDLIEKMRKDVEEFNRIVRKQVERRTGSLNRQQKRGPIY